jgi:hypothetical protein
MSSPVRLTWVVAHGRQWPDDGLCSANSMQGSQVSPLLLSTIWWSHLQVLPTPPYPWFFFGISLWSICSCPLIDLLFSYSSSFRLSVEYSMNQWKKWFNALSWVYYLKQWSVDTWLEKFQVLSCVNISTLVGFCRFFISYQFGIY